MSTSGADLGLLAPRYDRNAFDTGLIPFFLLNNVELSLTFAATAMLVYDSALTMDEEIEYIWSNLFAPTSWIYLLNRYNGIFMQVVNILRLEWMNISSTFIWMSNLSVGLVVFTLDIILLMRTRALYAHRKAVCRFMCLLLLVELASGLGLLIHSLQIVEPSTFTILNMTFCSTSNNSNKLYLGLSWTIPVLYGLILLVLTVCEASQDLKASFSRKEERSSIIEIVVRDQFIYFLTVIFCSVCQAVSLLPMNASTSGTLSAMGNPALLSLVGSRIILHLKAQGRAGSNGGVSYTETLTAMDFDHT